MVIIVKVTFIRRYEFGEEPNDVHCLLIGIFIARENVQYKI